jgi:hypothetical protein
MVSGLESGLKSGKFKSSAARCASGREGCRRQPTEEAPRQTTAIVENDARRDRLAVSEHVGLIAYEVLSAIHVCDQHPEMTVAGLLRRIRHRPKAASADGSAARNDGAPQQKSAG